MSTEPTAKELMDAINKVYEEIKNRPDPEPLDMYHSKNIEKVATAFAKAQSRFRSVGYNRENPYFKSKFADLDAILRHVRPSLAENGLTFYQFTKLSDKGPTVLHSRILHSSGQWIETRARIVPPKNDQQSYGSTLSYQKRYAAMTILGITASDDRYDDDGEIATHCYRTEDDEGKSLNTKYNPKEQSYETITKEQIEEIEYELAEYPDLAENLLERFHLQTLAEIPKSKFLNIIDKVREIKAVRNGAKKK